MQKRESQTRYAILGPRIIPVLSLSVANSGQKAPEPARSSVSCSEAESKVSGIPLVVSHTHTQQQHHVPAEPCCATHGAGCPGPEPAAPLCQGHPLRP
ncbi:hypothetical protein V5799_027065 [Amblyomma americanum]|uniref:Uncharacterized protein n=1 Tax=Amblyomma americanum TaxID=6943 RepID=A0AAQ4DGS8_AMBAM